jgi:hypothetical protein
MADNTKPVPCMQPSDEFEIKLGRKQIKLIPLGSTDDEE